MVGFRGGWANWLPRAIRLTVLVERWWDADEYLLPCPSFSPRPPSLTRSLESSAPATQPGEGRRAGGRKLSSKHPSKGKGGGCEGSVQCSCCLLLVVLLRAVLSTRQSITAQAKTRTISGGVLGEWLKLPPCSPRHTIHLIHAFRTGTCLVVAGLGKVPPELGWFAQAHLNEHGS